MSPQKERDRAPSSHMNWPLMYTKQWANAKNMPPPLAPRRVLEFLKLLSNVHQETDVITLVKETSASDNDLTSSLHDDEELSKLFAMKKAKK